MSDRILLADRVCKARRRGVCSICRGPIEVGTRIGRVAGRWSEIGCILGERAAERARLARSTVDVITSL